MVIAWVYIVVNIILNLVNPLWGFIGLIGSILIRFQDRYPEISQYPTFLILFLTLCLGVFLKKDKNIIKCKQDKVLLAFIAWVFLGLLFMEPGDLSFEMKDLITGVSFYYFASRLAHSKKDILLIITFISIFTAFLSFEATYSFYTDTSSPFFEPMEGRLQGLGFYANANEFGRLMLGGISFLYILIRLKKNIIIRILSILCSILLFWTMTLTLSRTCTATFGIMVLVTYLLESNASALKKGIIAGILVVTMTAGLSIMSSDFRQRIASIGNYSSDKSFQGRTRSWEQGFEMITWYPIFGVGKGQWIKYHGLAPHNSYVQVMAETGLFGVYAFFWLIILTYKEFKKIFINKEKLIVSSNLRQINISLFVSYLGYLLYITFGNQAYSPWTYIYIGLFIALNNIYVELDKKEN